MGDVFIPEDLVSPVDVSTVSNDVASGYQNDPQLKKLYLNHEEFSFTENSTIEDIVAAELGDMLRGALLIQDSLTSHIAPSDGNKDKLLEDCKVSLSKPPNVAALKTLNKCETFPCSRTIQSCTCVNGSSRTTSLEQSCMRSDNPVDSQSMSQCTTLKLVSAMKGSREKRGIVPKKLTVTWAPDVYDPPVTSVSHTVTSYHQHRSRTSKKYGKQKHKGKSSRGSNGDKKQHRKYVGHTSFHSNSLLASDRMVFNNVKQATVELIDFAVNGQDTKCGSSFLRNSHPQLHFSVAEAT